MPRESARMWQMQSRILVRAEFCACGQWHRGESAEFTHRLQSNEIRANPGSFHQKKVMED
jgi:hypothetical protein